MKIFHKLMIGFSIIAFIVALLSLINFFYYTQIENHVDLIAKSNMLALESASKSAFLIQQTKAELQKLFIASLNQRTHEMDRSKQAIKEALDALDLALFKWKQAIHLGLERAETEDDAVSEQEELQKLDTLTDHLGNFRLLAEQIIFFLDQEVYDDAEVFFEFELEPLSGELQTLIKQLDADEKFQSIAESDKIVADVKAALRYNLYSTLLAFSIALILGYFISKSLSQSITKLQKTTTEIGKGHLDVPVEVISSDELGQLAQSISAMAGNLKKNTTSIRDLEEEIVQRMEAEENLATAFREKELLLRELYHRTKNNMQVIRSMLVLQAAYSNNTEVQEIIKITENRIEAMALVHQKLYQSKDLSKINLQDYILDLIDLLMESYGLSSGQISLKTDLEDVYVSIDMAIPCGLALNELITNTLKYAFPEGRKGEISVDLHRSEGGTINLQFSDNGIGVPKRFDFRSQETLGLQTIMNIVEHQLQGKVHFENGHGVTCRIQFDDSLYRTRV